MKLKGRLLPSFPYLLFTFIFLFIHLPHKDFCQEKQPDKYPDKYNKQRQRIKPIDGKPTIGRRRQSIVQKSQRRPLIIIEVEIVGLPLKGNSECGIANNCANRSAPYKNQGNKQVLFGKLGAENDYSIQRTNHNEYMPPYVRLRTDF